MGRVGTRSVVVFVAFAGVAAVSVAAGARPAPSARLTVTPPMPYALEPARIELRSSGLPTAGLRVRALSPTGKTLRVGTRVVRPGLRRGAFRFTVQGTWRLRVTDPTGKRVPGIRPRSVRVLAARPTPPPAGFGALGQSGCSPPSPLDPDAPGTPDVFGTAMGEELWALPFVPEGASWARSDEAVFDGLVGKEVKIVFGMTSFHSPFRAVGPDGTTLAPVWGPLFHGGSNWDRQPGSEWGAGFVFPVAGCWRIAVGSRGSLYFLIRS